ncbi:MAG TPA: alpha/beta hydrolase [Chitinophagaceae bacterium]|nr:alpha/beta hydrolase [Chitinophagaceae bacterium]
MKKILIPAICMLSVFSACAQKEMPLYEGAIPNARPCAAKETSKMEGVLIISNVTVPTLTAYIPPKEKQNGTAVLVIPGGGYSIVAAGHEGADIAKAFNEAGITAFVLKYRLPNDDCMTDKMFVPLMDAQQALYTIRKNAKEYGIDTSKVGVMGFSAGGHLAATLSTHFDRPVRKELAGANLRPDFSMLIYPVISFHPGIAHMGSRENLIGKNADEKWVTYFSNEDQVNAQTPPAFIVQATDDDVVPVENSIVYYNQLIKYHIPAAMHLYEHGGHGFGLNNHTTKDKWFDTCLNWLRTNKWL